MSTEQAFISMIVPTLNEAETLPATLRPLIGLPASELIVVDGGSLDGTIDVARQYTEKIFRGARGRSHQMNFGAMQAKGSILLFLHADTALNPAALESVRRALEEPMVVGGAFRLRIASDRWPLKIIGHAVNLRSRYAGLPYGDQALFVRRSVFEAVNGFASWPLMEDVDLVRRLRARGRIVLLPDTVTTSARRWEREGIAWTTLRNGLLLTGFFIGISPGWLAKWYRAVR